MLSGVQGKARTLRGQREAAALDAIDQVAIHPTTLAVMQLRALQDVASAPNTKVVVPYEAAGLVGGAQVLVDALKSAATADAPSPRGAASAGAVPPAVSR
ncbi:MAG: hypothetical protein ACRDL8_03820 [Solirubrobacteraceae bacterium]